MENTNKSSDKLSYLARQPILDESSRLAGYELLFRGSGGVFSAGEISSEIEATARVLSNAIHSVGIERLLGSAKGFLNCNEEVFKSEIYDFLDPQKFVLEILEHTKVDSELIEVLKNLKQQGFVLALDDFDFSNEMLNKFMPLIELISIVKLEITSKEIEKQKEKINLFKNKNITVLAEKVETIEDFKRYKEYGCSLFQGYFFAKPETVSGKKIDPAIAGVLNLIKLLNNDAEIYELEKQISLYPEIMFNLLRFVNTAAFGFRKEINSIKHALALVGRTKLKHWLSLMIYSKPGVEIDRNPILILAGEKAKLMETLAKNNKKMGIDQGEAFLTGIVSLMDVVLAIPLQEIVSELQLSSNITNAILNNEGKLGNLLVLATLLKENSGENYEEILKLSNSLNIKINELFSSFNDSIDSKVV